MESINNTHLDRLEAALTSARERYGSKHLCDGVVHLYCANSGCRARRIQVDIREDPSILPLRSITCPLCGGPAHFEAVHTLKEWEGSQAKIATQRVLTVLVKNPKSLTPELQAALSRAARNGATLQ